jgi:CarD family transcriptional regulator
MTVISFSPEYGREKQMFKVGDMVVYPIHGVARVTEIRTERIGDSDKLCYILEAELETAGRKPVIKLPIDRAEGNRVRPVVSASEVPLVIDILKDRGMKTDTQTWNRRHREYQEKMRTGSIFKAAEVYRDLTLLKETKELSHGERRLFDQARNLLIKELSVAQRTTERDVESAIGQIFGEDPTNHLVEPEL